MKAQDYARCMICSRGYASKAALDREGEKCLKCGYPGRTLDPAKDVVVRTGLGPLLWLTSMAKDQAWVLSGREQGFAWAPKVVRAIRERLVAQKDTRRTRGLRVNWHELQVLGYWGSEYVTDNASLFPERFVGKAREVHTFLMGLETDHMDWPSLAASLQLARDQMARWFAKHVDPEDDPEKPVEDAHLTEEAVDACPTTGADEDDLKLRQIHDLGRAKGSTAERKAILDAQGKPFEAQS